MSSRVLVVDDDAVICEFIQKVLLSAEIESLTFTSSQKAFQHLANEKFDAVYLDVNMPSPDGIELTRKIRSGGLNSSTPIVVITGEKDRALLGRAFAAGANFFLYKPVDRQDILRLVRITQDSIEHERRRFRRIKVECRVTLEFGSARISGSTLDLSVGGMFVQSSAVLPVGTVARTTLDLRSDPLLVFPARVLRVAGGDCMGLQFENMGAQQTKRLQDFLLPMIGDKTIGEKAIADKTSGGKTSAEKFA
jgi:CheY-like chemotaxis protein